MTNISAMKAIAELNKLQGQRNEVQAQPKENNQKPNSIFEQSKISAEAKNLDNQIGLKRNELDEINKAEKKPVQANPPEFE